MNEEVDPTESIDTDIRRTTRDPEDLRDRLQRWLATRVDDPRVSDLSVPDNGMSSETVLFEASWRNGDSTESAELVARLAAAHDAMPAFPRYDLVAQAKVMDVVGRLADAPVPAIRWIETDRRAIGCEFFVMDREHGEVPPDVMPYPIESFLTEASEADRRRLQDASIDTLARIHATPLEPDPGAACSTAFLHYEEPGGTALHRHFNRWVGYERWACAGHSIDLVERARSWLEDHWPATADARYPVLSWGDARIGNIMYRDFEPVAVFDWEMAGIAPREVDLGWMIFLHRFFQDITVDLGLPGLPEFMTPDAASERYAASSGIEPLELDWFLVYAAYRHAAIMVRILDRRIHFGEAEPDAGGEAAILHREALAEMIS